MKEFIKVWWDGLRRTKTRYKFLRTGLKSHADDDCECGLILGEWRKEDGEFNVSKTPWQALWDVGGEILAKVEVRGKSIIEEYGECWPETRIIHAWYWAKEDSVALTVFLAELCLDNFEQVSPLKTVRWS